MADDSVVIIGAGLMGAACAWSLARRGIPVVVLEQFGIGHLQGSSHGSSRIVRRAYSDPLYVRLTGEAFELWRSLEMSTGARLLRMMGGLDFGPRRDVAEVAANLSAAGVAHEVLSAAAAQARWPGMRFDSDSVFHPEAGTLDADAAVRTMLAEAVRLGAIVHQETAATALRLENGGVRVECSGGPSFTSRCAVAATGAWVGPLLDGVIDLPPLRVTQQQVFHFPRVDPRQPPWPTVIHAGRWAVYHLPGGRDGGPRESRKLGVHDGGSPATATGRDGIVSAVSRTRAVEYVRQWLPGLDPEPHSETTCLYTETASQNFLIDRVGPVVVCSPCSGHGAKFAPLVGEYVADLVTGAGQVPERFLLRTHALGRAGSVSL